MRQKGFTIVELIIAIVVIAVIATIAVASYSGIQNSARGSAASAELIKARDLVTVYDLKNHMYPASLADAGIEQGAINLQYSSTGSSYCITATSDDLVAYYVDSDTQKSPAEGVCVGHYAPGEIPTFTAYRFQPTDLRNLSGANSVQLSEFQIYSNGVVQTGATGYGYGSNSPGIEGPDKLTDSLTNTKWLNFNKISGYAYIVFPSPVSITSYRWATANDATDRDPVSWEIYGSNDTTGGSVGTWTLIDTITGYATPTARQTYLPEFTISL